MSIPHVTNIIEGKTSINILYYVKTCAVSVRALCATDFRAAGKLARVNHIAKICNCFSLKCFVASPITKICTSESSVSMYVAMYVRTG